LRGADDGRLQRVADILAVWDYRASLESVGPTLYQAFIPEWERVYAVETLPNQSDVRAAVGPAARRALLREERPVGDARLGALIVAAMRAAMDGLAGRFGEDVATWTWGRAHTFSWPHPLGGIGKLGEVLNGPRFACGGTDNTINNVSPSNAEPFVAISGPTYR